MGGGRRHRRDDQEKQSICGRDAGGGVAAVVVAEAHLDVVPADAVLFVALVRDLFATGVLEDDQRSGHSLAGKNTNEPVGY